MHGDTIATRPRSHEAADPALHDAIKHGLDCARACMSCADACLAGDDLRALNRCLQLSLDCADRCFAVAALSPRRVAAEAMVVQLVLEACARAGKACAAECRRAADLCWS